MGLIEAFVDSIKSIFSFIFKKHKEKKDLTRRQVVKLFVVYKVIQKVLKSICKIIKMLFKCIIKVIKFIATNLIKFIKFLFITKEKTFNNETPSRENDNRNDRVEDSNNLNSKDTFRDNSNKDTFKENSKINNNNSFNEKDSNERKDTTTNVMDIF